MPEADTYPSPLHGWTCFHCGETFHNPNQARAHFGPTPEAEPACILQVKHRTLLMALRFVEQQRDEMKCRLVASRMGVDEEECVARLRASRARAWHPITFEDLERMAELARRDAADRTSREGR